MGKNSNISDEDILKEETQPGVVVYRSNVPKGAGVFDMDIAPGIKEAMIPRAMLACTRRGRGFIYSGNDSGKAGELSKLAAVFPPVDKRQK